MIPKDDNYSIFTVRNEVAKVVFSQAGVCPQEGCLVLGGGLFLRGAWSRGVPGPGGGVLLPGRGWYPSMMH